MLKSFVVLAVDAQHMLGLEDSVVIYFINLWSENVASRSDQMTQV